MPDKEWCGQHGISTTSLYRHIRKLKAGNKPVPGHSATMVHEKHEVVPLRITEPEEEPACFPGVPETPVHMQEEACGIHISVGPFRLYIGSNASTSILQDTLSILQKICQATFQASAKYIS